MKNYICKILGENLRRIRKSRNLKQDELAELVGVEVKSLSLIETGNGFVSAKTLEKLVNVLNVSLVELFVEQDKNDADTLYNKIIEDLELIKNNPSKLNTVELVIKSLI